MEEDDDEAAASSASEVEEPPPPRVSNCTGDCDGDGLSVVALAVVDKVSSLALRIDEGLEAG